MAHPDNRGTVVYDKSTKQESVVDYLGDIKDTHTAIKPPSTRHKHVGGNWVNKLITTQKSDFEYNVLLFCGYLKLV
jgi:hypothetical protein